MDSMSESSISSIWAKYPSRLSLFFLFGHQMQTKEVWMLKKSQKRKKVQEEMAEEVSSIAVLQVAFLTLAKLAVQELLSRKQTQ
ncbi:predicted protein [Arabidopsis lyrata subsp. lyrata]|uniref:Predicted protein n=1 Tax=Arabidopsis lyrata subsp. lyrata TaxID=81972 RepID=D7KGR0_ARALL|nr:predicted protein [Arabidopsis lyrata subsp. lyrata]